MLIIDINTTDGKPDEYWDQTNHHEKHILIIFIRMIIKQTNHKHNILYGISVDTTPMFEYWLGISEDCFILDFASLPLEVAWPI